jgi:hypothetical protein
MFPFGKIDQCYDDIKIMSGLAPPSDAYHSALTATE